MTTVVTGSGSSSAGSTDTPQLDIYFDKWASESFRQKTEYFEHKTDNGTIVYAMTGEIGEPSRLKKYLNCLKYGSGGEVGLRCNTCNDRAKVMSSMRGPNGAIFPMDSMMVSLRYRDIYSICSDPLKHITGVKIITDVSLFPENVGGFDHFNSWSTKVSDAAGMNYTEREELAKKYIPLVFALFLDNGVEGIHSSMDLLIEKLPKVHYGNTLLHHAQWFRRHIPENFRHLSKVNQYKCVIEAILDAPYARGDNEWVMQCYHQVKNTTLQVMACAHNLTSLGNMLEKLLAPDKYQRRQKEASENSIKIAIKKLGDFTNTLMTYAQALSHGAITLKPKKNVTSAGNVMKDMLQSRESSKSRNKGKAAGLSARVNETNKIPDTLADLLNNMPDTLEVYVDNLHHFVAAGETTLGDKVMYPWLWQFYNGKSPSQVGLYGWVKVKAILPIPFHTKSFIFICEGAKVTDALKSCNFCIEEFLSVSHRRDCGTTFAELNRKTKMVVPTNTDQFVIGVGMCVSKDGRRFASPFRMRIGNEQFTISELGNWTK